MSVPTDFMLAGGSGFDDPRDAVIAYSERGWLFSQKMDGVRVMLSKGVLTTRGRQKVPDTVLVRELLAPYFDTIGGYVLDGELVAVCAGIQSPSVAASFAATGVAKPDYEIKFRPFDILARGGFDLSEAPLRERLAHLADVAPVEHVSHGRFGSRMWENAEKYGWEGLIAKDPNSSYVPGRSSRWVKIKRRQVTTCIVVGSDLGKGARVQTFGALHLAQRTKGGLSMLGRVGSGFTDADLDMIMRRLGAGLPFCIDVEHLGFTEHGKLREPVFVAVSRTNPMQCWDPSAAPDSHTVEA